MKKRRFLALYMAVLMAFSGYVMADTFLISRAYGEEASAGASGTEAASGNSENGAAGSNEAIGGNEAAGSNDTAGSNEAAGSNDTAGGNEAAGSSETAGGNETAGGKEDAAEDSTADDEEAGNQHSGDRGGSGNGSGKHGGPGGGRGPGHGGPGKKDSSGSGSSTASGGSSGSSVSSGSTGSSVSSGPTGSGSSGSSGTQDAVKASSGTQTASAGSASDSYSDENISITLKEYRENDTTIHVADVRLSDPSYLKTALAQGTYGRNITAKTSEIAESAGAVLAVNGDFYGAQEKGYVIRNGTLYRDTALANQEDLVIYKDGSFGVINESSITADELIKKGAVQTLSFGPALVQNGSVTVNEKEEVGQAMASNPRTAIGIIDEDHYVFVVSDGRTDESEGLSLSELAEFMDSLGTKTAYNLDGGGSSTMFFNGNIVNDPTTGGRTTKERSVSDIVYIG